MITRQRFYRALLISTALTGCGTASPVFAQLAPPPPVRSSIDSNGVDLFLGTLNVDASAMSMGQHAPQGLSYHQINRGIGWTDNIVATLNISGSSYATVTIQGATDDFTVSGTTFTSVQQKGSTLTISGSIYTYTNASDVVAHFDAQKSGTAPFYATGGRVTDITSAAGAKVTFAYDSQYYCSALKDPDDCKSHAYLYRVHSATNSYGYRLTYTYYNDGFDFTADYPPSTQQLGDWGTVTSVSEMNLAAAGSAATTESFATSTSGGNTYYSVTDPMGRVVKYRMNVGAVAGVTLPSSSSENLTVAYSNGKVISVASAAGTTTYASSDSSNTRTTTVTDALSHPTTYVFDIPSSRMTSVTTHRVSGDNGYTTSFAYDSNGRLTQTTSPELNYTIFYYDNHGNVISTIATSKDHSTTLKTQATYLCTNAASCSEPTTTADGNGNDTDYTYDPTTGLLLTVTQPAPTSGGIRPQTRYSYTSYQAYFNLNGGGIVASGQPVMLLTAVSTCQTTSSCAGTIDEIKTTTSYGPQTAGTGNNLLPIATTSGAGDGSISATTALAYDTTGNITSFDGPLSGNVDTSMFVYDADRELTEAVGPDPDGSGPLKNRALSIVYTSDGIATSKSVGTANADGSSFSALQQLTTTLDSVDRPVMQVLSAGGTTYSVSQTQYDGAGRVACQNVRMNPSNWTTLITNCTPDATGPDRVTAYGYDNANHLNQVTSASGTSAAAIESIAYSANGKTGTVADGNGNLTTYIYDGFDRLSQTRYPTPNNGSVSSGSIYDYMTYDANSNLISKQQRDGNTIKYTYDALNRVSSITYAGTDVSDSNVTLNYNLTGRLIMALDANAHPAAYSYDALGHRLSEYGYVAAERGYASDMTYMYDAGGRMTRATWPDGFYVTYDYDVLGEVTAIHENGGLVLASFGYDDLGRRTIVNRANGTASGYTYDGASRLAQLTHYHNASGSIQDLRITLNYNAAGQITSRISSNDAFSYTDASNANRTYTANGLNQYTQSAGVTLSYDGRGNLSASGATNYTYNSKNQMASASGPTNTQLYYDPIGQLDQIVASNTEFDHTGGEIASVWTGHGSGMQRRFVYGPGSDEPVVWYEGSGTMDRRYLESDERGSVVAVDDGSANIIATNTYDEYGIPGSKNSGLFQYTGQAWLPELGMYYYKARMYSPTLGRFMQTDPIGYGDGLNWYNYVHSDPVNSSDPTGLGPECGGAPGSIVINPNSACPGPDVPVSPPPPPDPPAGDDIIVTAQCGSTCQANVDEFNKLASQGSSIFREIDLSSLLQSRPCTSAGDNVGSTIVDRVGDAHGSIFAAGAAAASNAGNASGAQAIGRAALPGAIVLGGLSEGMAARSDYAGGMSAGRSAAIHGTGFAGGLLGGFLLGEAVDPLGGGIVGAVIAGIAGSYGGSKAGEAMGAAGATAVGICR